MGFSFALGALGMAMGADLRNSLFGTTSSSDEVELVETDMADSANSNAILAQFMSPNW